jgi:hypothetical protein
MENLSLREHGISYVLIKSELAATCRGTVQGGRFKISFGAPANI